MAYNAETLSFEMPDTDTIYVAGLPSGVSEAEVATHFGSIGVLKIDKKKEKPKIWLYRDKATGGLKVLASAQTCSPLYPVPSSRQGPALGAFPPTPTQGDLRSRVLLHPPPRPTCCPG